MPLILPASSYESENGCRSTAAAVVFTPEIQRRPILQLHLPVPADQGTPTICCCRTMNLPSRPSSDVLFGDGNFVSDLKAVGRFEFVILGVNIRYQLLLSAVRNRVPHALERTLETRVHLGRMCNAQLHLRVLRPLVRYLHADTRQPLGSKYARQDQQRYH